MAGCTGMIGWGATAGTATSCFGPLGRFLTIRRLFRTAPSDTTREATNTHKDNWKTWRETSKNRGLSQPYTRNCSGIFSEKLSSEAKVFFQHVHHSELHWGEWERTWESKEFFETELKNVLILMLHQAIDSFIGDILGKWNQRISD